MLVCGWSANGDRYKKWDHNPKSTNLPHTGNTCSFQTPAVMGARRDVVFPKDPNASGYGCSTRRRFSEGCVWLKMKNKIDINLNVLPTNIRRFVKKEIRLCNENNISVLMSRTSGIKLGQFEQDGFFDDDDQLLTTACGKSLKKWLPTFVHETCHRDQYVEGIPLWNKTVENASPMFLFHLWLENVIELTPQQKYEYMMHALEVELDCEKRTVCKIVDNDLPIHPFDYIQRANSYVYFYHVVSLRRKWYQVESAPYNTPEVWSAMPNTFDNDYSILPKQYLKLYNKYC
jgi:hypothetical protein